MRRLICILLICQMLILPNMCIAGENPFMDPAIKAVADQHLRLENAARNLVYSDFSTLVRNIIDSSGDLSADLKQLDEFYATIALLQSKLESINYEIDSNTKQEVAFDINKILNQYKELSRQAFDLSWMPSAVVISKNEFVNKFRQIAANFKYTCEVGRNDYNFDSIIQSVSLPGVDFDLFVQYGMDEKGKGDVGSAYSQQSAYASKSFEKVRSEVNKYSGIGAYGLAQLINPVAASGIGIALVVGMALAANIIGNHKRNKLIAQLYESETYKTLYSFRSKDFKNFYKDECTPYVSYFDALLKKIDKYNEGGNARAQELQAYNAEDTKFKLVEKLILQIAPIENRLVTWDMFKAKTCIESDVYDNKQNYRCQKVKEILYCPFKKCEVTQLDDQSYEKLKLDYDKLQKQISKIDYIGLAVHSAFKVFAIDSEKSFRDFNVHKGKWDNLVKSKMKLLNLIASILNQTTSMQPNSLRAETEAFNRYASFQYKFKFIIADCFKYVFGKKDREIVLLEVKNLKDAYTDFYQRYLQVPEVRSLYDSMNWTLAFLENQ